MKKLCILVGAISLLASCGSEHTADLGKSEYISQGGGQSMVVVARPTRLGDYSYRSILVLHDHAYLQSLRDRANAALIRARAKAREIDAKIAAIHAQVRRLEQLIGELNFEMAKIERQAENLQSEEANAYKLFLNGLSGTSQISSIFQLIAFTKLDQQQLFNLKVEALSADEFVTAGKWQVVNERLVRTGEVKGFAGGNMLEFLEFLKNENQNLKAGGKAHEAVQPLSKLLHDSLAKKYDGLLSQSKNIRKQMAKRYQDIEDTISKIK